ncbi:hypothetical protein DTQ13_02765 [Parasaccharibacter sp. TMW 2.1888]|uniref:DUF6476 family protein n=1 Tax=Parasaccharibacter sp. TMW 2.1888 TaxID=2268025 RepID=UPI00205637F4|nr:DUF6476 family protein [Parasaccharibacter sp. TMW 2.1888]UPO80504.1 hypothetical protein DTQ13_02765 [Parasaccharibacter sp. TMW 2.1888]
MAPNLVEPGQNSESNPPRTPRALVAAVIIMGVMIILGTVLLVGIIIHRMMNHSSASPAPAASELSRAAAGPALLKLPRQPDEQVMAVTARPDGLLAVTLKTGQGDARILLWQPEQARLVAELDLTGPAAH